MMIKIHTDFCVGSGACVLECPEVFAYDDNGMVTLLDANPPAALHDKVRKAASVCPTTVIEVVEDVDGQSPAQS